MEQLRDVVHRSTAMAQGLLVSSQQLYGQADLLQNVVAGFKLRNGDEKAKLAVPTDVMVVAGVPVHRLNGHHSQVH